MEWRKYYKNNLMSAEEAVDAVIKDGDTVSIGGLAIAKKTSMAMFEKIKNGKLKNITLDGNLITDELPLEDKSLIKNGFRYKCWFLGGFERQGVKAGTTTMVPLQFVNFDRLYKKINLDVGILNVSPPNEDGYCNVGPIGPGFMSVVAKTSKRLIGQVNKNMPRACGDPSLDVHVTKFNAIVEEDSPIPIYPIDEITEIDKKIANNIIDLIPDEATIQLGLGKIDRKSVV